MMDNLGASDPSRRAWAERIADQFGVDDPAAIDAIEEGVERGRLEAREWIKLRRVALDELIPAVAKCWGAGSDHHNLVRDVADALFRDASGIEARQPARQGTLTRPKARARPPQQAAGTPNLQGINSHDH